MIGLRDAKTRILRTKVFRIMMSRPVCIGIIPIDGGGRVAMSVKNALFFTQQAEWYPVRSLPQTIALQGNIPEGLFEQSVPEARVCRCCQLREPISLGRTR